VIISGSDRPAYRAQGKNRSATGKLSREASLALRTPLDVYAMTRYHCDRRVIRSRQSMAIGCPARINYILCGELQELIKNLFRLRPCLFVNGILRARARSSLLSGFLACIKLKRCNCRYTDDTVVIPFHHSVRAQRRAT